MTTSRLNSIVDRLTVQIKKYFDFGIENVVVVTNIVESSIKKIEKELHERLLREGISKKILIIPQNIEELLNWLDKVSQEITSDRNKKLAAVFEQKSAVKTIDQIDVETTDIDKPE